MKDSALVLAVMPLALAGGLLALKLLNLVAYQSLDMLTMIGFIILLGLVVNNAILLVSQTREAEASGLSRLAAVRQAVRVRVRPVYMSTLTSIFGMLPLLVIPGVGHLPGTGHCDHRWHDLQPVVHFVVDAQSVAAGTTGRLGLPGQPMVFAQTSINHNRRP